MPRNDLVTSKISNFFKAVFVFWPKTITVLYCVTEILRILYLTKDLHRAGREVEGRSRGWGQVERLRACGTIEAKISCSFKLAEFWRKSLISSKSNWARILSYQLKWQQFKKLVHSVHQSAPFLPKYVEKLRTLNWKIDVVPQPCVGFLSVRCRWKAPNEWSLNYEVPES